MFYPTLDDRIGIHSGDIIAGVVGTKKFAYNISFTTYEFIKDHFECKYLREYQYER